MNKTQKFISLLFAVLTMAAVFSCKEDDKISYMPTWKGFDYSPRPVVLGDSVTIVAQQGEIGNLIYKAVYTWTAVYHIQKTDGADSTVTLKKTNTVVYDNDPSDPTVKFLIPRDVTSRNFSVSFKGEYHYSASGVQADDGSLATQTGYGSLHRSQSSTLYGISNGTLTIPLP